MKKILLLAVTVVFTISVFGQTKSELEEKGRKQIKTGFIIMGAGTVVALSGLLIGNEESESSVQSIVVLTGVTAIVTGIVIASLGAAKKGKAYHMIGTIQTLPQFRNGNYVKRAIPSIGLRISMGR